MEPVLPPAYFFTDGDDVEGWIVPAVLSVRDRGVIVRVDDLATGFVLPGETLLKIRDAVEG